MPPHTKERSCLRRAGYTVTPRCQPPGKQRGGSRSASVARRARVPELS
jgi:hypothetical protein